MSKDRGQAVRTIRIPKQPAVEVLIPHLLNFCPVIGNASFYLLWKASCDLKTEEDNSLEHGSMQVSKQSDSRAKGPDRKTPTVPSFSCCLRIRKDLPDERSMTISRKERAGTNATKASVNVGCFPYTSSNMRNDLPNSPCLNSAWESKQSKLHPCSYQGAATPFREVLVLSLSLHVISLAHYCHTLFLCHSPFSLLHSSEQQY